jgi:photosystem II stability/assembly factor-like uncharacterized protein
MATADDPILYLGTAEGLYLAEKKDHSYDARLLGLKGKGTLRAPVVIDRTDTRRLYAATSRGGVFRSEDRGQTWREINEGVVYKEAWSLVQHPMTGELYLGTGPSSIFKSLDGGDTWIDCEQLRTLPETEEWTFPNPPHISHVKGLSLCADDPLFIFGAIEEGWLIRSKDGGKSWQNIKEGTEFDSHSVMIMPDNPKVIVSTSGKGVYRSLNGGDSFVASSNGLNCRYLAQLVVHPARPKVLFTAAAAVPPPFWRRPEGAASAFYRSEDQGACWERLKGGLPEHFKAAPRATAGDPENPDAVFVGMTDGAVWMSDNGGESFSQILAGLPQVTSIRVVHY